MPPFDSSLELPFFCRKTLFLSRQDDSCENLSNKDERYKKIGPYWPYFHWFYEYR